jgi:hypothetical protein
MSHIEKQNPGYETSDVSLKGVAYSTIGLFVLIGLSMLLVYGIVQYMNDKKVRTETPVSPLAIDVRQLPPEPRLQVIPEVDLERYTVIQDSLLHSEGWISKDAGMARIPIEVAMTLTLERGFPVRKGMQESTKGR